MRNLWGSFSLLFIQSKFSFRPAERDTAILILAHKQAFPQSQGPQALWVLGGVPKQSEGCLEETEQVPDFDIHWYPLLDEKAGKDHGTCFRPSFAREAGAGAQGLETKEEGLLCSAP